MDEKYTIRVLPAFVQDMQAIVLYISHELQNPEAAERLTFDIQRAIETRATSPLAFEPFHSKVGEISIFNTFPPFGLN